MKPTRITQIVIVHFELDPHWDREDETTRSIAARNARLVLSSTDIPHTFLEHQETRFMPQGQVEVEYKTTRVLDNPED